jgi:hypothetical protein
MKFGKTPASSARLRRTHVGDFRMVGRKSAEPSSGVEGFLVQLSTGIGRRLGYMLGNTYSEKVRQRIRVFYLSFPLLTIRFYIDSMDVVPWWPLC